MKIGECCNREVVVANRDTEIAEIASLMRQNHVGDIVVVDRREGAVFPIGIVTDRDLVVEVLAADVSSSELSAGDVMGAEIATVSEENGIWETLERMRELGIRRMPVVGAEGELVGLVTLDDLLDLFTEAMDNMTGLIKAELKREARLRRS